jgi:hypothetical protein
MIAALEAANGLLNATVTAQAAEIAELRRRLLGRNVSLDAAASMQTAPQPPPPRLDVGSVAAVSSSRNTRASTLATQPSRRFKRADRALANGHATPLDS